MKKLLLIIASFTFYSAGFAQYNYIDEYIGNPVSLTEVGNSSNQINQPRDLDFKPNSNELWVANNGTGAGGSMVIFYNAGQSNQTSEYRKDSHSGHFMIYPPAFAFGEDGYWANVNEIKNTSSSSSTFMGPALWTADTNVFARVFQSNWVSGNPLGSHLDMLHQSPFAMGIAHDSATAFWVADGHNGNIVLYDFGNHHSAGYDDHSDGKIWRYTDISFTRVPQVPSHMILDKSSGWLYFIDGGPKKIKRMDTNSGTQTGTLSVPSTSPEQLAGYWQITGATVEDLATLTTQPSGIDYHNDRLVVSDYTNGDIYIYNTSGTFNLIGTINTGLPGMMGVKIGPDGKIWAVNHTESKVYRLDPSVSPPNDLAITQILTPGVENFFPDYYSPSFNYCDGNLSPEIVIQNTGSNVVTSVDLEYNIDGINSISYTWSGNLISGSTATVTLGSHLLEVKIISVNGLADDVSLNNILTGSFRALTPPSILPFAENFEINMFPPLGWNYINFNGHNEMSLFTTGGFGNSYASMRMNNFAGSVNISGQVDYLMSPLVDMSGATNNTWMIFSLAYAKYNASSNDVLEIHASADCGNSWSTIYSKSGTTLTTAPNTTTSFVPTPTQWRTDSINLSALSGQAEVVFMLKTISDYGNNLYIDDIVIGNFGTAVTNLNTDKNFNIYPNPGTGNFHIQLGEISNHSIITVYSANGSEVKSFEFPAAENKFTLDLTELKSGMYFLNITTDNYTSTKKIIKE